MMQNLATRSWLMALSLLLALFCLGPAQAALTPEEATRVGGDLSKVGGGLSQLNDQLAEVKTSINKIALALPELPSDFRKVQQTITAGRGEGEMAANALASVAVLVVLWGLGQAFKRLAGGWRAKRVADENRSRGAVSLVLLDLGHFGVNHSLVYTLRISIIAYFAYHIFELSTTAKWWYKLVQHAIAAGAILSLSIMLSELWLVERLGLMSMAKWTPIRHSLETTAITLFAGFIGWRYLDLWTEERLRAASGGLSPTQMDEEIAVEPASRLTTALPLARVLSGVAILFFVAFLGMSQLGVDVTTLLAGAGVFGLALSFGSQALVRDIVSGVFFMSDDAFRVGEYIDTGRLKGTVERVTLRSVRLRHQNGQIHTIPFGQLNSISNFSRDWQTVKFNLRLARDACLRSI